MTSRSEHPVAIVTGGCGGIGSAVVDALTGRGLRVAVFDLPRPDPEYEPGKNVLFRELDITDSTAVASAVDSVVDELGRLDVVVNNAAVLECYAVHDTPESDVPHFSRGVWPPSSGAVGGVVDAGGDV